MSPAHAAPVTSPEPVVTPQGATGAGGQITDRLACPDCAARLEPQPNAAGQQERSFACGGPVVHRFSCNADGTPILLRSAEREALYGDLESADLMTRDYHVSLGQRVARTAKSLIGSTLHQPISSTVVDIWDEHDGEPALEVGSGIKASRPGRVNLDIAPFRNVDVVGSALHIPFLDDTFQLVRNAAVLEHVREPRKMIAEMRRVLRPGGYVYTEVPFLQHFHAYPNDFQRYTVEGLKQAFSEFEIVETGVCVGPASALTALIADWCELLTFSRNRLVNDIARTIPLVLLWPLKFLDYFLIKNPRAHELASGVYLLARKPESSVDACGGELAAPERSRK